MAYRQPYPQSYPTVAGQPPVQGAPAYPPQPVYQQQPAPVGFDHLLSPQVSFVSSMCSIIIIIIIIYFAQQYKTASPASALSPSITPSHFHSRLKIFSINLYLHSSSTFPPTGLTPRTPAVFRFSQACRF